MLEGGPRAALSDSRLCLPTGPGVLLKGQILPQHKSDPEEDDPSASLPLASIVREVSRFITKPLPPASHEHQ